jgi:SAM-dependent methyltransferase
MNGAPFDAPDPRWEAFAAREPHFAVLTTPKFLRAHLTADAEREFFETGAALVDYMFRVIQERLAPDFAPTSILEYGCGIGRLAIPLAQRAARRSGTVVAVDRSPAMLGFARREAERHRISNIVFATPAAFRADNRVFDFVSCYLVLQRMREDDGRRLIGELLGRLAPGGIAVVSIPYRSTVGPAVRALRSVRERLPFVNSLINVLRRKPAADPFIASHTYDLSRVVGVVQEQLVGTMNVVLEPQEGLNAALLFLEKPLTILKGKTLAVACEMPTTRTQQNSVIDVASLTAETSIEELNRAAENYFSALDDREHQLTKPFSQPQETPSLLSGTATVLQGLELAPGLTVLEFGAGTGWLSRCLTQLGCRMILLDVSPTALQIARELYDRLPIIGERPAPQFLVFDGHHIDLPDGSVDRILCFHSFHHVAEPAAIIREFGRVLGPAGIAGFAEPGPRHSRSSFSQFEMRTYNVVENDIDVHDLWRAARDSGFKDIRLAVFHGLPFHTSLQEFEDFLAGGTTTTRWVASTRVFMRNVRTFFLTKEGATRFDSRWADRLAATIHATVSNSPLLAGHPVLIDAVISNAGQATWLPSDISPGGVSLGAHLYDDTDRLLQFDIHREPLTAPPRPIAPGETIQCRMAFPAQAARRYVIELDCVAERVAWFGPLGSRTVRLPIEVLEG